MKDIMIITYEQWAENNSAHADFVRTLNFKGYVNETASIDENGNPITVKSRSFDLLDELSDYDFSDCYLYYIESRANYDQDLSNKGVGFLIRFTGKEKKMNNSTLL